MFSTVAAPHRPSTSTQDEVTTLQSASVTDDTALVRALIADDPRAWREFNTRFSRLVLSTINRVTVRFSGIVSPEDTREIYATFCVQLLANDKIKLRSFDPERGSKLSTWLGLLASHTAYDFLRGARREPRNAALSEAEDLSSTVPDPCENALMRERAELVSQLLTSFSDKDRTFIQLYFGDGLDPELIAERLNISVKTVYSKRHKIQARLQALLAEAQLAA